MGTIQCIMMYDDPLGRCANDPYTYIVWMGIAWGAIFVIGAVCGNSGSDSATYWAKVHRRKHRRAQRPRWLRWL